jgi:ribosome biogenesis GTPase A
MKEHPGILEKHYKIDAKGNPETLLEELGKRKGFLRKGGEVNDDAVARLILKDWQEGKIKL